MALKLETDPSEILNEMIMALRKGGRMGVVGVYAGTLVLSISVSQCIEGIVCMRQAQYQTWNDCSQA